MKNMKIFFYCFTIQLEKGCDQARHINYKNEDKMGMKVLSVLLALRLLSFGIIFVVEKTL